MAERVTSIALELEMARGRVVADLLGEVTVCRGFQEVPDAVAERYIAEVQQDRLDTPRSRGRPSR